MTKRIVAFVSILLFSTAVMGYLWWGRFQYHHSLLLSAAFFLGTFTVLANHVYFRDSRRQLGLRLDNFRTAAWAYGGLTLGGLALVLPTGWLLGSPEIPNAQGTLHYFLWAGTQQYLLQNLLRLRSENLFTVRSSPFAGQLMGSTVAAALFAGFHWPNTPLVALTFVAGLLWCLLFARVPNLLCAWITQGVLAMAVAIFFKTSLLGQFEVGLPGFRYEYYGGGVLVAGGYDAGRNPLVATLPGHDRETPSRVRIFDPEGHLKREWTAFPEMDFSGRISVGDLGYQAGDEVAVTPGPAPGNSATVRIFDLKGHLLSEFEPDELGSGYGASISIACERLYLTPGPGPGAPRNLFEFSPQGRLLRSWSFPELPLHNGFKATAICPREEENSGSFPGQTLLLWGTEISVNPATLFVLPPLATQPTPWEVLNTTYGVQLSPMVLGGAGRGVALAPGPLIGYPPLIRIVNLEGQTIHDYVAYADAQACGSNLGAVDIDADGIDEVILGEGVCRARSPTVRILRLDGTLLAEWQAY